MGIADRDSGMMREAARLAAAGGGLGKADAIRLLQIPHSIEDVRDVLRTFSKQLSPEAKSKLTLDALVPRPHDVANQRDETIFDKHPITGATYTTATGNVIPDELQYYNGEMAHFYGECTNVWAVNDALAGSGYKAVTLKYADGRQTAVAQLWSSRFTDTSIRPYSALFIVVVVVRDDAPPEEASVRADANGGSSVLVMLDGSFDPAAAAYENRARLFLVRLLDTTQVAIDFGRERMGTDKRPGTVDMTRSGRRLQVSIKDQAGRGVVRADLELADVSASYTPEVAKAAATAGIPLRVFPRGTEYVYPAVARIGRGPVVSWQWRSDLVPRLQPLMAGTVLIDWSSEEGRMLLAWGFTPKVLGYIANVRGVITGLAARMPEHFRDAATASPAPAYVGAPPRGIAASMVSAPTNVAISNVPLLRTTLRGDVGVAVGQLPVLRLVAEELPRHGAPGTTFVAEERANAAARVCEQPRWKWETTFLGSLTATLRKEVVGVTRDGLRINWHVTNGSFVGPGFEAVVLPGAVDWTRIRTDGVGIVNVEACLETPTGERIYASYGGLFDLGPDGYARALRDEYDHFPPVVVAPTYATSDPRFEWLNRVQCIGVGRVDMTAPSVEFDVYVVGVGKRADGALTRENRLTLYSRLGGHRVIEAVTDDFVAGVLADKELGRFFANAHGQEGLRDRVVELLCEITGGPCAYKGRDMKTAHKGMGITEGDWAVAVDLFTAALNRSHVAPREQSEFLKIIEDMKALIVEVPGGWASQN
jgi:truncated hemoglobin YjbI